MNKLVFLTVYLHNAILLIHLHTDQTQEVKEGENYTKRTKMNSIRKSRNNIRVSAVLPRTTLTNITGGGDPGVHHDHRSTTGSEPSDWLRRAKRAAKPPTTTTHPTGHQWKPANFLVWFHDTKKIWFYFKTILGSLYTVLCV